MNAYEFYKKLLRMEKAQCNFCGTYPNCQHWSNLLKQDTLPYIWDSDSLGTMACESYINKYDRKLQEKENVKLSGNLRV